MYSHNENQKDSLFERAVVYILNYIIVLHWRHVAKSGCNFNFSKGTNF